MSDTTSGLNHRADVIRVFTGDLDFLGDLSVDHVPFGIPEAISGLGFDDDTGDLGVSTRSGNVYQLPEPGVPAGLAIGAGALCAARRRRAKQG